MAAPGVINVGEQVQQNAAYMAYLKYKETQQKPNTSSNITYPSYENPEYSGKPATKQQVARDVLNQRDKGIVESNNSLTSYEQTDQPTQSSYIIKPESKTDQEPLRWLIKEELDAFNKNNPVPKKEDVDRYNNLVNLYNKITTQEKAKISQENIKSRQVQLNEITQAFTAAKEQGVTKIEILDVNKNVIGSVNPQNVPQSRLEYLQLTRKGAVSYRYPITKTETNTTVTTPTYREDPLSLIVRPVLAFGAEVGNEIIETFKSGKFTGKTLNPFDLTQPLASKTVQEKSESVFGVGQEISKVQTNQYSNIEQSSAILGIAIATAIPILAGARIEKPPEFNMGIKTPLLSKVVKSTEKGFIEVPSFTTISKETIDKNTILLSQGTASNKGIEESSYIYTPLKYIRTLQRPPLVKSNVLPMEEAITKPPQQANEIIGIGAKGEPIKTGVYKVNYGMSGYAKTTDLSLAIVTPKKVTFVTAPSGLPPQKIMIHAYGGASPDVEKGLTSLGFVKEPQLKDTYTAKYTPELAEFIKISQKGKVYVLFSKQIAELHSYPPNDIIKQPVIYGEASRNPETLETGFLPGGSNPLITRPEVTQFYEVFKLKPKIPVTTEPNLFERTNQKGSIKPDLSNIHNIGLGRWDEKIDESMAKALGESEDERINAIKKDNQWINLGGNKATEDFIQNQKLKELITRNVEPDLNNFHNIGKITEIETIKGEFGISELEKIFSNMAYQKESSLTEDLFYLTENQNIKYSSISSQKSALNTKIESIPIQISKSESIGDIIQEQFKNEKYKEKNPFADLESLTRTDQDTGVLTGQKTSQITNTKQTTKQIQDLVSGTPEINITEETNIKIPPIEFLLSERKEKKQKTKKGSLINFLGGTPQYEIIGLYKNRDITFGSKKINKITRQEKTEAERPYNKFFKKRTQKLRPSKSDIRWSEKKPKKVKEVKF